MRLPRVVLASLAGAYELGGVSNCRWPVKPLAEGVSDERPRRRMVPAGPCVQVPKQCSACLGGDASLEDTGGTSPIQFVIAEDVSFGSACKPSGFGPVTRKLPPIEPIKEQNLPVRVLVGLGGARC